MPVRARQYEEATYAHLYAIGLAIVTEILVQLGRYGKLQAKGYIEHSNHNSACVQTEF